MSSFDEEIYREVFFKAFENYYKKKGGIVEETKRVCQPIELEDFEKNGIIKKYKGVNNGRKKHI